MMGRTKASVRVFANDDGLSKSQQRDRAHVRVLLKEKMKVLKEFYIVNDGNEDEIRAYLEKALADNPKGDPRLTLDRAAAPLIRAKLFKND